MNHSFTPQKKIINMERVISVKAAFPKLSLKKRIKSLTNRLFLKNIILLHRVHPQNVQLLSVQLQYVQLQNVHVPDAQLQNVHITKRHDY